MNDKPLLLIAGLTVLVCCVVAWSSIHPETYALWINESLLYYPYVIIKVAVILFWLALLISAPFIEYRTYRKKRCKKSAQSQVQKRLGLDCNNNYLIDEETRQAIIKFKRLELSLHYGSAQAGLTGLNGLTQISIESLRAHFHLRTSREESVDDELRSYMKERLQLRDIEIEHPTIQGNTRFRRILTWT